MILMSASQAGIYRSDDQVCPTLCQHLIDFDYLFRCLAVADAFCPA